MQTTGQKIIDFRSRQGWTQEELADEAGVTVRTIQRIEPGATQPRLYTLKVLAEVLGTTVELLLQPDPAGVAAAAPHAPIVTAPLAIASFTAEPAASTGSAGGPDPVLEKQ